MRKVALRGKVSLSHGRQGQDVDLRAKGCTAGETERTEYNDIRRQKTEATEISVERRKGDHSCVTGICILGVGRQAWGCRPRDMRTEIKNPREESKVLGLTFRASGESEESNGKRKTETGQDTKRTSTRYNDVDD